MQRKEINEIVETWKECGGNYYEAAQRLGIDRRTVCKWIKRGRQPWGYVRWKGLKRESTTPKSPCRTLSKGDEQRIVALRKETSFCAEKLRVLLYEKGLAVSELTIHRLLSHYGPLRKAPGRRRPFFQNGNAMRPDNTPALGYLQMDVKHVTPELSGLPYTCFEYAAIDILSRYKVAFFNRY